MGRKGGAARAANLSAGELSDVGRKAIKVRWDAYYKLHPDKLRAKLEREAKSKAGKRKAT